jgi:hypothetical protein
MFARTFYIFIPSWIQVNIRNVHKHLLSYVKIGTSKATEYEPVNLYSTALTLRNVPNTAIQRSAPHSKGSGFETSPGPSPILNDCYTLLKHFMK